MIRQLPLIPTVLVVAAAATMVWLGFWQLGRAEEKAELIARYSDASGQMEPVPFPTWNDGADVWFRRSNPSCTDVKEIQPVAGTSQRGAKGWAFRATCHMPKGDAFEVDLGFSRDLEVPEWDGGAVSGIIAPGPRVVADPAIAGLEPLAKPNPNDLPNNHLAYAGQWFFFALTALVIYFFAVRSRLTKRD